MKKLIVSLSLALLSINSFGFEVLALGTSNTNCKNADQAYTSTLNDLLRQEKINVTVVNGGVDGDKPTFMQARLEQSIKANTNIKMGLNARIFIAKWGHRKRSKQGNVALQQNFLAKP
jgi:hypothetical protein